MKSRTAFEYTIRKMERTGRRVFFWTFTFRDVHSLKVAMRLWNEFLTILKRKIAFRGVRVLELHDDHGAHFHVVTNKRYKIRAILALGERYGFGRTHVVRVTDVAGGIAYLCKYLSKRRAPCLKRVRLWAAFGAIERTRVSDIVVDSPFVRLLREAMGSLSPEEVLGGVDVALSEGGRYQRSLIKALPIAWEKYLAGFDSEYKRRQIVWEGRRFRGQCQLSRPWFGQMPETDEA